MSFTFIDCIKVFFSKEKIIKNFGTRRIFIRFLVQKILYALGYYNQYKQGLDFSGVRRLVFVCHGNIFRSAYAEAVVAKKGILASSFGLAAVAGDLAAEIARACAKDNGVDLEAHRAKSRLTFEVLPGDLVVVMDHAQLKEVEAMGLVAGVQYTMLGLWSRDYTCPVVLDPYGRGELFCKNVYMQINDCLEALTMQHGY